MAPYEESARRPHVLPGRLYLASSFCLRQPLANEAHLPNASLPSLENRSNLQYIFSSTAGTAVDMPASTGLWRRGSCCLYCVCRIRQRQNGGSEFANGGKASISRARSFLYSFCSPPPPSPFKKKEKYLHTGLQHPYGRTKPERG